MMVALSVTPVILPYVISTERSEEKSDFTAGCLRSLTCVRDDKVLF
jgi:hypothetical protein